MAKKSSILINSLGLEPKKINSIVSAFSDLDQIFNSGLSDLSKIPSLSLSDAEKILAFRDSKNLDRELELIKTERINCLDIFDENYPKLLRQIANPPLVLYVKGDPKVLDKFSFAIVGSRNPTQYGLSMAAEFSASLSALGIVIISGLAKGIDTAAHIEALRASETIAVLGSGLLNVYPRENKDLAERISQKGAVISEFSLNSPPSKENFPRRNRVVSGLSRGILVVEAAARSGALITARFGCEQNREVFALPGNIDSPLSKGNHRLIKEGAKLVDSLDDILEELNINEQVFSNR